MQIMTAHEYLSKSIEMAVATVGFDAKANSSLIESLYNIARLIDDSREWTMPSKIAMDIDRFEHIVTMKLGLSSIDMHIRKAA